MRIVRVREFRSFRVCGCFADMGRMRNTAVGNEVAEVCSRGMYSVRRILVHINRNLEADPVLSWLFFIQEHDTPGLKWPKQESIGGVIRILFILVHGTR